MDERGTASGRARPRPLAIAALLALAACAPPGPAVSPPPSDAPLRLAQAALAAGRGTYASLKEACRAYADLYAVPALRSSTAQPYLIALLRLALREKELGVPGEKALLLSLEIVRTNKSLAGWEPWLPLAAAIPSRLKGIVRDYAATIPPPRLDQKPEDWAAAAKKAVEAMKKQEADLKARALQDELFAYLALARRCASASIYDKRDEVEELLRSYPDSLQLKYRAAFCPAFDDDALKAVLAAEPGFLEIHGLLGESALARGRLLEAERGLLQGFETVPESAHFAILLASILYATEEFDRSLEFYDRTLALSPEYRDALLGKGICLSAMGRHAEAIAVLKKNVELQFYLLGESHYWLAWNYHQLKDDATAQLHIEESKGRLPTNAEVFELAGTIALERGEPDRAEAEFKEALRYDPASVGALFGLARISDAKRRWTDSAGFYERAGAACEAGETALAAKIAEIRAAALPEARKARMAARKEEQLKTLRETTAAAHYNAAVAWTNAGNRERALEQAGKAALHPAFKERAGELAGRLKKQARLPRD